MEEEYKRRQGGYSRKRYSEIMEEALNWRVRYVSNSLNWVEKGEEEKDNRYTRKRWGPPMFLDEISKGKWEIRMREARQVCKKEILVPWLYRQCESKKMELLAIGVDKKERIEIAMEAGDQLWKRWSRRMNAKSWGGLLECARLQEWLLPREPSEDQIREEEMRDRGMHKTVAGGNGLCKDRENEMGGEWGIRGHQEEEGDGIVWKRGNEDSVDSRRGIRGWRSKRESLGKGKGESGEERVEGEGWKDREGKQESGEWDWNIKRSRDDMEGWQRGTWRRKDWNRRSVEGGGNMERWGRENKRHIEYSRGNNEGMGGRRRRSEGWKDKEKSGVEDNWRRQRKIAEGKERVDAKEMVNWRKGNSSGWEERRKSRRKEMEERRVEREEYSGGCKEGEKRGMERNWRKEGRVRGEEEEEDVENKDSWNKDSGQSDDSGKEKEERERKERREGRKGGEIDNGELREEWREEGGTGEEGLGNNVGESKRENKEIGIERGRTGGRRNEKPHGREERNEEEVKVKWRGKKGGQSSRGGERRVSERRSGRGEGEEKKEIRQDGKEERGRGEGVDIRKIEIVWRAKVREGEEDERGGVEGFRSKGIRENEERKYESEDRDYRRGGGIEGIGGKECKEGEEVENKRDRGYSEDSWYIDLVEEVEEGEKKKEGAGIEEGDKISKGGDRKSSGENMRGRGVRERIRLIEEEKGEWRRVLSKLRKKRERIWKKYSEIGRKIKEGKEGRRVGKKGEKEKEEGKGTVVDMTSKGLKKVEREVLELGKSYVFVEERVDRDRLEADIAAVMRRVRLRYMFSEEGRMEEEGNKEERGKEGDEKEDGMIEEKHTGHRNVGQEQGRGVRGSIRIVSREGSREEVGGDVTRGIQQWEKRGQRRSSKESEGVNGEGGKSKEEKGLGGEEGKELSEEERKEIWRRREASKQRMVGRIKSSFVPSMQNKEIDELERLMETEIAGEVRSGKKRRDNLSKEKRRAVSNLKRKIKEKEIIITQADKGGGLVAIDYKDYVEKGNKYIKEEAGAYEQVNEQEEEVIRRLGKERDKIAEGLKKVGIIDVKIATFIKHQARQRITGLKFFLKIHKSVDKEKVPVRPLQSCIHSPMQNLAIILNDILMPYMEGGCIDTYVRDSNSMLYILKDMRLEEGEVMYTADVSALYPSIPHDLGMIVMERFLEEFRVVEGAAQREKFIEALRLVITQNHMKWEGQIYRQTSGVAMGTPVAVAYANIFMNYVDRLLKSRCGYIREFRRYIDDNWFIIPRDKEVEFREALNGLGLETIRYTTEKLEEGGTLAFLDINMVIKGDRSIGTRLYTKPTDKHPYLLPTSFHPPTVSRGIPYSVFCRIRRLCSEENWYWEDSSKAIEWLVQRGYRRGQLELLRRRVGELERWKLVEGIEMKWLKKREGVEQRAEEKEEFIPFVTTYNTKLMGLRDIIKKYNKKLEEIFHEHRVQMRMVFKRPKNVSDLIIQPGLRLPIEGKKEEGMFRKCGLKLHRSACACGGQHDRFICRMCMHVKEKVEFCKQVLKRVVTCESRDVIYVLWCEECGKKYVGETRQPVRERVKQHLVNIRCGREEVYAHFRWHKAENLRVAVLEDLDNDDLMYRKVREARWIRKLNAIKPNGLNSQVRDSPLDVLEEAA